MPNLQVDLPVFFPKQQEAYELFRRERRVAIRGGRRSGKTDFAKSIVCNELLHNSFIGWFAPDYRIMAEAYNDIRDILSDVVVSSSKVEGVIRTMPTGKSTVGGRIDFWTLENERAGRSRKYHGVVIDEAAFGKNNVMDIWKRSIEPTLLDYVGWTLLLSNTNGVDPLNFFYRICETEKPDHGFAEFHWRSSDNPLISRDELDRLQKTVHPLVWRQEYMAEFVDFSGDAFFNEAWLLLEGSPVPYPTVCKAVGAVIDTAVKTGKEHDATAVLYYAVMPDYFDTYRVVILDWDLVQIEGALLEVWIKGVFARLEELAKECKAAFGSLGADIEDAQSGSILLQQCALRGYPATPLPAALTAAGKDARAINVSGPIYRGEMKYAWHAYEKVSTYKGATRNQLRSQINGFRIGDKDAARRSDDLFDCLTYAAAITLGGSDGIA